VIEIAGDDLDLVGLRIDVIAPTPSAKATAAINAKDVAQHA
jgi:hypothetical protein